MCTDAIEFYLYVINKYISNANPNLRFTMN